MRITAVIHSLDGGGAERVMAKLVSLLAARGHQVTLITLDDGANDRHTVSAAVARVQLARERRATGRSGRLVAAAQRLVGLRRAIGQTAPDVVLSFCDATNVSTLLATLGLAVPVVVSERSDPATQPLPPGKAWLRRRLYRRAAEVVVLTSEAAETVAAWTRRPPVIIPSAVDPPPMAPEPGVIASAGSPPRGNGRKTIIGVGRLEPEKGFDQLLEAFARLAVDFPAWDLEIHGDGSQRESLRERCDRGGLRERVRWPGWTTPIWPALRAADLFVLPSRYEGFPSALLEAMAAGLACVATDCPSGPRAIIRHSLDGILVPPNDPAALAAAMRDCMADAEERARLGEQARAVVTRFGWETMVDGYAEVLQRAAGLA